MSKSFTQHILAHQNPSAPIGPFDGLAAAYTRLGDVYILITSPNQHHIPLPVLREEDVRLRANLRYGAADHTLWPQFVTPETSHFAVMPRRPADDNDTVLAPIWWEPSPADFVPSYGGILSGLGTIPRHRLDSLQRVEGEMQSRIKTYLESSPKPSSLAVEQINLRQYHMENSFIRLSGLRVSYVETVFTITEFQRNCLEIIGFLNFMQIYRPRLAGLQLASYSADHLMGCFTWDPRATQDLFKAGVPVWFLRRWEGREYPFDNNVLKVVDFTVPDPSIMKEHPFITFPTLFRGFMTDEKRYRVIWDSSLARLTSADPFRGESTPQPTALSSSSRSAPRPYPLPGNRPTKSNERQHTSRNKYLPLHSPAAPYSIDAWRDALTSVDQSPANIIDQAALRTTAGHYVVPDPGVVVGPETDEKKARYLTTWLQCRNSWFLVVANDGLALSNQSWRDILGLDLCQGLEGGDRIPRFQRATSTLPPQSTSTLPARPLPLSLPARPSRPTSSKSRSSGQKKPEERRQQALELLKHKSIFADAVRMSDVAPHIVWNGTQYPANTLPSEHVICEILWELYEINFVYELEALDRRACKALGDDTAVGQFQRQKLIVDCYDNIHQYKCPSIPSHNIGLAADEIMDRFPFVLSLARLMKSWNGNPPASFAKYCDSLRPEMLGRAFAAQMERDVARFYCQTFFNYFGRAAQVPHRLYMAN